MPKLSDDKKSLGEIAKLPAEEGDVIFEPYVKANLDGFKGIVEAAQTASKAAEAIRSAVNFPLLDFVKNIQLPDMSALINLQRDPLEGIDMHALMDRDKRVVIQKSDWEIEKEEREMDLLNLQIAQLKRSQQSSSGNMPQYDINTGVIAFAGTTINIPLNSKLELICRVVLKNEVNMRKKWSWDQIVEANRIELDGYTKRTIYMAARSINQKVALKTQIDDLLLVKPMSTVQLNPKYLTK